VTKVAFQFSGGKDSAHALGRLLTDPRYEVTHLITLFDAATDNCAVHAVPRSLMQAQARAIGLPLLSIDLDADSLDGYGESLERITGELRADGVETLAFGDLEHSGADRHRRELLSPLGIAVVEPLWGMTSAECMEAFLASGIEAVTVVVDAAVLDREHVGRVLDREFVEELPLGCDPCGESGEYHSFVAWAPYFRHRVDWSPGQVTRVERRIGTTEGPKMFAYWQLELRPGP